MSRRAAILGLGRRGEAWAELCLSAGWEVRAFDPAPNAASAANRLPGLLREATISSAVMRANWIICCVPDRLELIQMVLKRAQAEAPKEAVVAVASKAFDIEAVQSCAMRPAQVIRLALATEGSVTLDVSDKNSGELKRLAATLSTELAAVCSLTPLDVETDHGRSAESA